MCLSVKKKTLNPIIRKMFVVKPHMNSEVERHKNTLPG